MGCGASTAKLQPMDKAKRAELMSPAGRAKLAKTVKRQCGFVPIFYIRAQFDEFDADKSGVLEANELVNMLENLSEQVPRELKNIGLGGRVGFETFSRWYIKVLTPQRIKNLFDGYDVDRSGSLTQNEIQALLKDLAQDAGPDAIKKALNDMDQNGDNEVSIMEFKRYFLGPWAKMQMAKQFKDVGVDVNGEIDLETLRSALNAMGSAPNDQILNEMFAKVDAGKRGSVPVAKFVSWATYQIK
jgi:Ca2+-binding EF-hand superfamily protein|uniref:EF-hand domain-containing protein n=2 Tax=Micromonas pusilla TaxID=38833 RepID=A0A7R9TAV5_MICPS|tara:strand:- start:304 stop:1032 length:729 start_codon:yes stop_codon:yes gene_type:complete|mmetsp:Transcript_12707/g.45676  ORF Transcript_12707/g.45676 Transcript_12707/m.45676 type:complete len:243 (+) Transcript_12707:211-939(+)